MRVEWEEDDIKVGRVVGKPGIRERLLIGYSVPADAPNQLLFISLSDGLVNPAGTKAAMAAMLTAQGYLPEELLTYEERS